MYVLYMCAISWRRWSFQVFQREYVFWAIIAVGDIIIFVEDLSDDGSLCEESETTPCIEKNSSWIGWIELRVWNKSCDCRCLGEKGEEWDRVVRRKLRFLRVTQELIWLMPCCQKLRLTRQCPGVSRHR